MTTEVETARRLARAERRWLAEARHRLRQRVRPARAPQPRRDEQDQAQR